MSEKQLNNKQTAFCLEYIKDFNITQAAIRVGYSEKTARQQGSRLFANVNVQNYIGELKDVAVKDKNKIIDENLKFWNKIRDDETERITDRLRASEYLGKYAAMFTEKFEHTGKDGGPMDINIKWVE
jgi:phage terminase small subunit